MSILSIKPLCRIAAAGALALATLGGASAADNTTANATATIIAPIAIAKVSDLLFGNVIAGSGGTIAVNASDAVTLSGVTVPSSQAGTRAAAVFTVTGEGSYTYAITLPSTDQTITHTNATDTMLVNTFVSNPSGTGALSSGTQTLKVGATLNVGSAQVAGLYSGAFTVTVAYN